MTRVEEQEIEECQVSVSENVLKRENSWILDAHGRNASR